MSIQTEFDKKKSQADNIDHNMRLFLNSINEINETNAIGENENDNSENNNSIISCDYVDIESFSYKENKDNLSFFHLNIASLFKHKEELEALFDSLNFRFDVIAISESAIRKGVNPIFDIDMKGYNCFYTPTEAKKVVLYSIYLAF